MVGLFKSQVRHDLYFLWKIWLFASSSLSPFSIFFCHFRLFVSAAHLGIICFRFISLSRAFFCLNLLSVMISITLLLKFSCLQYGPSIFLDICVVVKKTVSIFSDRSAVLDTSFCEVLVELDTFFSWRYQPSNLAISLDFFKQMMSLSTN